MDNSEAVGKAYRPSAIADRSKKKTCLKFHKNLSRQERVDLMTMAYETGHDIWTLEPFVGHERTEWAGAMAENERQLQKKERRSHEN